MEREHRSNNRETSGRRKKNARHTTPGPDRIHSRVLGLAMQVLGPTVRDIFSACLREGHFPHVWKRAKLMHIEA